MDNCIFCKIVASEIPAANLYEDDAAMAFLDINPVQPGHTLVIPKAHYPAMGDVPDELLGKVFSTAKRLLPRIQEAMNAEYVELCVVGTEVPHFHIHLIPRRHDDGLAGWWPRTQYGEGEMGEVARKIKNAIK